jgi:E3 SUMO-protein ligase PIAS1
MVLNQVQVDRIKTDSTLRLLLFCAADPIVHGHPLGMDIAFPHQLEIKVNGEDVKANFKGLKNKPGSTRPADITGFCRTKLANYQNQISVMYALTQKRFYMQVILARKHSVKSLTERIQHGRHISKQRVIGESTCNFLGRFHFIVS